MGLLAPLYALAALAVVAPVIFHLIRRQPRGQVEFSSLMFLQASPPRLTRRSRLDNLWLLLLRATALILIALAFARPFLRSVELADAQPPGREILMLIDTSGSMQRQDVWQRAVATASETLAGLGANDRVGLATFDTQLNIVVPLPDADQKSDSTPQSDQAAVQARLRDLKPSYRSTHLAEQLIAAAELMQARKTLQTAAVDEESEIVLISDLHEGSSLEALQGFAWPENIRLDIRRVASDTPGNARATLMQATPQSTIKADAVDDKANALARRTSPSASAVESNSARVRIENNANSSESRLSLTWTHSDTSNIGVPSSAAPVVNVQVPPGQARIVPVPLPADGADRMVLSGDAAAHDNTLYVPRTAAREERLGFIGPTSSRSEDDLYFFLSQVPLSTPIRNVRIERLKLEELSVALADDSLAGLVVEWPLSRAPTPETSPPEASPPEASPPEESTAKARATKTPAAETPDAETVVSQLENFCRQGRPLIVVLARPVEQPNVAVEQLSNASQVKSVDVSSYRTDLLNRLLGIQGNATVAEAPSRDFALLSDIDFRHRLFQPLADAKFNDFSKVRFWSHRSITLPSEDVTAGSVQVLARFDDQTPAIIHRSHGRGDVWLLSAGWQSTASQLALSSKFVPLLFGMLDPQGRSLELNAVYEVGQVVDVATGTAVVATKLDGSPVQTVSQPSGLAFEEPGLVWLSEDGKRRQIAIALPLSESQLDPLDVDRFTQYGVVTGKSHTAKERNESARLSQVTELESRQKLWRWILIAALGFLVIETLVASRFASTT